MMYRIRILTLLLMLGITGQAREGLWLPFMLLQRESEMQSMGLQLSAADIYSVNQSSLKDAIVSFGGFCTGELISDQGLILTNHHCGYGAIQSHSKVGANYLEDGFWAENLSKELINESLKATFVKYMEDVTDAMMAGLHQGMSDEQRSARLKANEAELIASRKARDDYDFEVKPVYYGNQYILIATVTYYDVRLVGAPPSSIGKFGADTDNWMWPRHTGDFSLFRIYADGNNQPARVSEDNVPYRPDRHLSISLKGTQPGDFTMIYGFPGRTDQYLPAFAVEQIAHVLNPMKVEIRDRILEIMDAAMRADEATKIQYASKYASTSNAWKKWKGQTQGLDRTHGIDSIYRAEARIQYALSQDNVLWSRYGRVLSKLEHSYQRALPLLQAYDRFVEIAFSGIEGMRQSYQLSAWVRHAQESDTASVHELAERIGNRMEGFWKNYNPTVDSLIALELIQYWAERTESTGQPEFLSEAFGNGAGNWSVAGLYGPDAFIRPGQSERVMQKLEEDPVALALEIGESDIYKATMLAFDYFFEELRPALEEVRVEQDELQQAYMRAQMLVGEPSEMYPDANSTMRLTYGKVEGYTPRDGVEFYTHTYLDGVVAKYVPGDYEFDLPERVLELHEKQEYGRYAARNGKLPVCFIASNHTSGGNSGSPALNGKGELIGLNFDRVWEGTMSDLYFDASICRNIMVDIRYVLWVVDVYAGAGHLVEEMTLVE